MIILGVLYMPPKIKGERFDMKQEKVYIHNYLQAMMYLKNGAKALDVEYNPVMDKVTFVFDRKATFELYQKWMKHELK